jgi:hypothetical protein
MNADLHFMHRRKAAVSFRHDFTYWIVFKGLTATGIM